MNRVKAAPVYVTMEHLEDGVARAIVANAGNANACAPDGMENARRMAQAAAKLLGVAETDVAVASTGVIGQRLNIECIEEHLPELVLEDNASEKANRAIMTTDTKPKTAAVEFTIGGKTCRIGGICKGSGMIHPNMGTMLSFITTDCAITHEMLTDALQENVKKTYNRVTVDGDTSTNDMLSVLANGLAGNPVITEETPAYQDFKQALFAVCENVSGKNWPATAKGPPSCWNAPSAMRQIDNRQKIAKSVICSSLFKAAMFGADANWGRVLCAIGYTPGDFDISKTSVRLKSKAGEVFVCENAAYHPYSEDEAAVVLKGDEIDILVDLGSGDATAKAWGCDLTYDYVKINGDYRT